MSELKLNVCGGCNAKIGAGQLSNLLNCIKTVGREDVLNGFEGNEDAAIIQTGEDEAIVFTMDFFPPMVDDPYIFGQIAAANALSDCYSMGAEVVSALNIVCYPSEENMKPLEDIIRGGADKLIEAGGTLSGGHSIHDNKVKYGMAVVGKVKLSKIWRNDTLKVGDALILTKPIGVSLIAGGKLAGKVSKKDYDNALKNMVELNKKPADVMRVVEEKGNHVIHAVTDITGFGLLGHLSEMIKDSYGANIYLENVPVLSGAYEAACDGVGTSGGRRNRTYYESGIKFYFADKAYEDVLFDPQTSGGLLISVHPSYAQELLDRLKERGVNASYIGDIVEKDAKRPIKVFEKK